jgi:hypothetical protein
MESETLMPQSRGGFLAKTYAWTAGLSLLFTCLTALNSAVTNNDTSKERQQISVENAAVQRAADDNNHFWAVAAGREKPVYTAKEAESGRFGSRDEYEVGRRSAERLAQAIGVQTGKLKIKDYKPQISDRLWCDQNTYEIGDLNRMVFEGTGGGFLEPDFIKQIELIRKVGPTPLLGKEGVNPPNAMVAADLHSSNKAIRTYNNFILMIGGQRPIDSSSLGKLARDLRLQFGFVPKEGPLPFRMEQYCNLAVINVEKVLGTSPFVAQSWNRFTPEFKAQVLKFRLKGYDSMAIKPHLKQAPHVLAWDEIGRVGDNTLRLSHWPVVLTWYLLITLPCFLIAGSYPRPNHSYGQSERVWQIPPHWEITNREDRWIKLLGLVTLPHIFLIRNMWVGPKWAVRTTKETIFELTHPDRPARRKAYATIKKMKRQPVQTERVRAQIAHAEAVLAETQEVKYIDHSDEDQRELAEASDRAAAAAGLDLMEALAGVRARKELEGQDSQNQETGTS